jgi:hypothetical protein
VNGVAAVPEASVVVVNVVSELLKTPLGPEVGALKVTGTSGTPMLLMSFTVTARELAKIFPAAADCGVVPGFGVREAGRPRLVSENVALRRPLVDAVTL